MVTLGTGHTLVPTQIEICNSEDVGGILGKYRDNIDPDLLWNIPSSVNTKFNHVPIYFVRL